MSDFLKDSKITFSVPNFAEIEVGSDESRVITFESLPQQIKPREIDPIREKFYEMRRLASNRPFARNDSELFYRQAKFMEDFEDDYKGNAKLNMYYPYYQNMGYDYLRTYFTWRTHVRQGEIKPISLSYIFLYIYELLSNIGVENPTDGLSKLLAVWDRFSGEYSPIEKLLPKWLKDYHVFYELPHSFSEFIEEHNMRHHYSLALLFDENAENKLTLWNSISAYDITNSKFYNDGNEQLVSDCFDAVLVGINDFCARRETRLEDMLVYSVSKRMPWQPFKQALFVNRRKQTDREVFISAFERYHCKNSHWTANMPVFYSSQKDFVGYIIKKTESCLRNAVNYKYKLVADLKAGSKPFRELQRPAAKRAELDKVIEKAVADFHTDQSRTVVEVDHRNLERIREEALGTQEQLIVPEEVESGEQSVEIDKMPALKQEAAELTLSFADGWKALKKVLTDVELKALSIALHGGADNSVSIKSFADENNIMLEVLADSINEKAADCIGDSILEVDEELLIHDEYRENVAGIVE